MIGLEGPSLTYVHVAETGRSGQSEAALLEARTEMLTSGEYCDEMRAALDYMITQQHSGGLPFQELRNSGRTLIAVHQMPLPEPNTPLDGLFYAEGTHRAPGWTQHGDAFSAVRMGLWLRPQPEDAPRVALPPKELAAKVVDMSLRNTDELIRNTHPMAWGVPVTRDTKLSAFPSRGNAARMAIDAVSEITYGEWLDDRAVSGLQLPDPLKDLLHYVVHQAHHHPSEMSFDQRIAQLRFNVTDTE